MKKRVLFPALLLATLPGASWAQFNGNGSSGVASGIVAGICGFIKPFVGSNSQVLSVVFLLTLGVMVLLWMLIENKEGVMVWLLRTGVALALLINIFTLPQLIGLPAVAC